MERQRMKVKICLVGEGAVGKTCLIRRFVHDQFDDRYISTLGAKVSKKELLVDGAQGVLAVLDVTRKETLTELHDWIAAVVKVTGNIPVEILANKADLKDQMAMTEQDVAAMAKAPGAPSLR